MKHKKPNRRCHFDWRKLPVSYNDKGSMVLSAPTEKQFARLGTHLMGEEPNTPSTKHVSSGSRFIDRDHTKAKFYGE